MIRSLCLVGVLVGLAACAAPTSTWTHATIPPPQWASDQRSCTRTAEADALRDNRAALDAIDYGDSGGATEFETTMTRYSVGKDVRTAVAQCMSRKGYIRK